MKHFKYTICSFVLYEEINITCVVGNLLLGVQKTLPLPVTLQGIINEDFEHWH